MRHSYIAYGKHVKVLSHQYPGLHMNLLTLHTLHASRAIFRQLHINDQAMVYVNEGCTPGRWSFFYQGTLYLVIKINKI